MILCLSKMRKSKDKVTMIEEFVSDVTFFPEIKTMRCVDLKSSIFSLQSFFLLKKKKKKLKVPFILCEFKIESPQ